MWREARWLTGQARDVGVRGSRGRWQARRAARRALTDALNGLSGAGSTAQVHPPQVDAPLSLRPGTSDQLVYQQIFVDQEYLSLDGHDVEGLVIDAGANVGYAAAWFLSRFPRCRVVALEPDAANFSVLEANLRPYEGRADARRVALWSEVGTLALRDEPYRDGADWSRQVRPATAEDDDRVPAIDPGTLADQLGADRIALLKVDIEGAEAVVFGAGADRWLPRVDRIVAELHDDSVFGPASAVFFRALGADFTVRRRGERVVCVRR